MSAALRRVWTQETFLAWVEVQDGFYEFDGLQPVAMNGGSVNHNRICGNIYTALARRLAGRPCQPFAAGMAIQTAGTSIRYPDCVVSCAAVPGHALLLPRPAVVLEVVSPSSGRMDRVFKVREYAAVPSILRYLIVDGTEVSVTMLHRGEAGQPWTSTPLAEGDTAELPEIGTALTVGEMYGDMFGADDGQEGQG